MPLRDHLREARWRLLAIAAGLVPGFIVGWILYPHLFALLQRPIEVAAEGRDVLLNFPTVAASLDLQVKVSLFAAVVISSPWWIYQIWAFITPGLKKHERRIAVSFVAAAAPLFVAGVVLAWLILPQAVTVLLGFTPAGGGNIIDATAYLSFVMRMTLAFGVAFLLPVLMVGLNLVGLVTARTWAKGWRWAILVSAVFAAAATPTSDVVSMLALMVPICLLYFAAVGLCWLHDRRTRRRQAA